ncbi:MAG: DUF1016 N-terminal domain-containing protein, partial [Thermoguttaceae bacterium]
RQQVAQTVNAGLVTLYWHIGRRIRQEVLGEERAEYGRQILSTLSKELTAEYGRGFGRRSLFRMVQFSESFPEERIVSALSAQLGWSHFVELISLEDRLKREPNNERQSLRRSSNDGNLPTPNYWLGPGEASGRRTSYFTDRARDNCDVPRHRCHRSRHQP